jgi:hypothetical protein
VRSLQEPDFLQTADRALFSVRGNDPAPEPCLMDANASLAHHVAAFDRIARASSRTSESRAQPAPRIAGQGLALMRDRKT